MDSYRYIHRHQNKIDFETNDDRFDDTHPQPEKNNEIERVNSDEERKSNPHPQRTTQFSRIHKKFGITNKSTENSKEKDTSEIQHQPLLSYRNQLLEFPHKLNEAFGKGAEGGIKMEDPFSDDFVTLDDALQFEELMNYTTAVLAESEIGSRCPSECFKLEDLSPTPSIQAILTALDLSDSDDSLNFYPTLRKPPKSELTTKVKEPESKFWYHYIAPTGRVLNKPTKPEIIYPIHSTDLDSFIGASLVQKCRSRYGGLFNPCKGIVSRREITKQLSSPPKSKTAALTRYIGDTMAEFGNINEATISSIRDAHERRENNSITTNTNILKQARNIGNESDYASEFEEKSFFKEFLKTTKPRPKPTTSVESMGSSVSSISINDITFRGYNTPGYKAVYEMNARIAADFLRFSSEEEIPSPESVNEGQTQDPAHKGHLLPGGYERAEVTQPSENIERISEVYLKQYCKEMKQIQRAEGNVVQDENDSKTQEQTSNSADTNQGGNKNEASTSSQGQNESTQQSTPSSSSEPQPSTSRKKRSASSEVNRSGAFINLRSGISKIPARIRLARVDSRLASSSSKVSSSQGPRRKRSKDTQASTSKRSTSKTLRVIKKRKSLTVEDASTISSPENSTVLPLPSKQPSQITIVSADITRSNHGLPLPRPTLKHGSRIGLSQEQKAARHVTIRLPTPANETNESAGQREEYSSPNANDITMASILRDALTIDANSEEATYSGYSKPIDSIQDYQIRKARKANPNFRRGSSPNALRQKAQSGYFGLLQRQRKLITSNNSSPIPVINLTLGLRHPQEQYLPPPPRKAQPQSETQGVSRDKRSDKEKKDRKKE